MTTAAVPAFRLAAGACSPHDFHVVSLRGREHLSRPYRFDLVAVCRTTAPQLDSLLGAPATLTIALADGGARHVHGLLSRVANTGVTRGRMLLEARLVPRLWLLRRRKQSRVFQDASVQDIVSAVLADARVEHEWRTQRAYAPREYCVQYQETDEAFVTRLLAEEGIFFGFRQPPSAALDTPPGSQDREVVLFGDSVSHYEPIVGEPVLALHEAGVLRSDERVETFTLARSVRPRRVLSLGYDYQRPAFKPRSSGEVAAGEPGDVQAVQEIYEHDRVLEGREVPEHVGRLRLDEQRARAVMGRGTSTCRRLTPGHWFELDDPEESRGGRYAVVAVEHRGSEPLSDEGVATGERSYDNAVVTVPVSVPFRPKRRRSSYRQMVESATVVGPAGEEIYTDPLGRIKVQFHWDRHGEQNEHSSCWIRPLQAWAGPGWGTQFIPRVGMEVLVGFDGGDVDRPVVFGCHYNGVTPPPLPLPEEKTRSGIRTRSTPGGQGANELIFEDAKGAEHIFIHAERDMTTVIEHDHSRTVLHQETLYVADGRLLEVAGDNVRFVRNNEIVQVSGNCVLDVLGNQSTVIGGGVEANPLVKERRERVEAAAKNLAQATESRNVLDGITLAEQQQRDHKLASALERLAGDDARAGRFLARQMRDLRERQREIDLAGSTLLDDLDKAREQYLTGDVGMLPLELSQSTTRIHEQIATLEAELIRNIEANVEPVAAIEEAQEVVLEDMEHTLRRLRETKKTAELARAFVEDFGKIYGGEGEGGGAADFEDGKKISFKDYDDKKKELDGKGKELDGSKLDVAGAIEITAGTGIKLHCGSSTVHILPGSILITSPTITIGATGKIDVHAGGVCDIDGSTINLN